MSDQSKGFGNESLSQLRMGRAKKVSSSSSTRRLLSGESLNVANPGGLFKHPADTGTLRLDVSQHVGVVALVDPLALRMNRWHGRQATSWKSPSFLSLKADIAATGGNVVPVLGCGLPGDSHIEVVYGSLRAQACRELGLPVLIVLQTLSNREVFTKMIREGAGGWSLFELGTSIVRALDEPLFTSKRKLTEACGLSHQVTSAAIEAAQLPDFVVQAYSSPDKLTAAAVSKLTDALARDYRGVRDRAEALRCKPAMSRSSVLTSLLGASARLEPDEPRV